MVGIAFLATSAVEGSRDDSIVSGCKLNFSFRWWSLDWGGGGGVGWGGSFVSEEQVEELNTVFFFSSPLSPFHPLEIESSIVPSTGGKVLNFFAKLFKKKFE